MGHNDECMLLVSITNRAIWPKDCTFKSNLPMCSSFRSFFLVYGILFLGYGTFLLVKKMGGASWTSST